jgi:Ca2+-binding RTX toxin-like protein
MTGIILLSLFGWGLGYALITEFTDDENDENVEQITLGPEDDSVISEDYSEAIKPNISAEEFDDSTIVNGPMNIDTGAGDDVIVGSASDDTIITGEGDDDVVGGEGDDLIRLGDGDDSSLAVDNESLFNGSPEYENRETQTFHAGNDTIYGGSGNDEIEDFYGQNVLNGGLGNDSLSSIDAEDDEASPDRIFGGSGSDTIYADDGDRVTTGRGRDDVTVDLFDLDEESEPVTITDFDLEKDKITLQGNIVDLTTPDTSGPDEVTVDPITIADYDDGTGATIYVSGQPVIHLDGGQGMERSDISVSDNVLSAD